MDIALKIEELKASRTALITSLKTLGNEQMTFIPAGSPNHILWNAGHILVVPEYYFYSAVGQTPPFAGKYINDYMTGSQPRARVEQPEIDEILGLLIPTLDQLGSDSDAGHFSSYKAFGMDFGGVLDFLIKHEEGHYDRIRQLMVKLG
jgi:hypothetical protein